MSLLGLRSSVIDESGKIRIVVGTAVVALALAVAGIGMLVSGAAESSNRVDTRALDAQTTPQGAGLASKEELGRLLFFDRRLSGDRSTSCSTCHSSENAWTDGEALSAGYSRDNPYFRNTPTLLNASLAEWLDWDGRFSGGDMDSLVRDHVAEAHFMNVDGRLLVERMRQVPAYEEAFRDLYGSDVSYGKVLDAVGAFVATLVSEDHPLLRFRGGESAALSSQAQEGLGLFEGKAGCAQCHSGELLSDNGFHALGVPENPDIFQDPLRHITFRRFFRGFGVAEYIAMRADPGLYALTLDEPDRGKFKTPSLLEAARTAPYMHNGTLETLEDVVRFYNAGGGDHANKDTVLAPLGLTESEISALVAFLEMLAGEETPVEAPAELPGYEPRALGSN